LAFFQGGEECIHENIRCLEGGEDISLVGTHLGHNLPDSNEAVHFFSPPPNETGCRRPPRRAPRQRVYLRRVSRVGPPKVHIDRDHQTTSTRKDAQTIRVPGCRCHAHRRSFSSRRTPEGEARRLLDSLSKKNNIASASTSDSPPTPTPVPRGRCTNTTFQKRTFDPPKKYALVIPRKNMHF
jgi:hypothetical protein